MWLETQESFYMNLCFIYCNSIFAHLQKEIFKNVHVWRGLWIIQV